MPWLVIAGYLVIGIAAYWPALEGISSRPFVAGWDFEQSVWFLAWVPHALSHGLNPFFSNAMLAPSGANLAQNTASPFLGLVTVPFSPFLGPMARANILVVLAMPLTASSAFFVLRKWHVFGPAAALGGLIFGFSSYMVDQNIELIFLPLVPLIALVIVSIVRGEGSFYRLGIQLGLLATAQYLISPEILTIVGIFGIIGVAFVAVRDPSTIVRNVGRPIGIAAVVSGVLLAYPIWMMAAGPQHFAGRTWPTINFYHNDVLSLVIPGSQQKFSLGMRSIGDHIGGVSGASGNGGYVGVLLLAVAGYLAWHSRRQLRIQVAVVLLLFGVILSLGPYVSFDGRQTQFPLPFLLIDHVPLLNDILPSRICLVTDACLAAVIAFGMDSLLRIPASVRSPRGYRSMGIRDIALFVGVLLGVLVATPPPQILVPNQLTAPTAVVLPTVVRQAVPSGDPIAITYPYATEYTIEPMQWQFDDGFQFRILGGYAYHPNQYGDPSLIPSVMTPDGLQGFLVDQDKFSLVALYSVYGKVARLSPSLIATTRKTLSRYDVRLVIVDMAIEGSRPVMTLFRETLGPPSVVGGSFSAWVGKNGGGLVPRLAIGTG